MDKQGHVKDSLLKRIIVLASQIKKNAQRSLMKRTIQEALQSKPLPSKIITIIFKLLLYAHII